MGKKQLFDDSDDEELEANKGSIGFTKNEAYAKKYEEKKKREELAQRKFNVILFIHLFILYIYSCLFK